MSNLSLETQSAEGSKSASTATTSGTTAQGVEESILVFNPVTSAAVSEPSAGGEGGEASSSSAAATAGTAELTPSSSLNKQGATPSPAQPQSEVEMDDQFFEPTLSDVRSHAASIAARNKRLNEAPLLTAKHRDAEKAERERAKKEKWPNTTIRVKFSDGTIVQNVFPSSTPIQPVYAFVRAALREDVRDKAFILWQPPRTKYPEHPIPQDPKSKKSASSTYGKTSIIPPANYGPVRGSTLQGLQGGTGGRESLGDLGLVPQSILMVKFDDEELNASVYPAPIRDELKASAQPLPPSAPLSTASATSSPVPAPGPSVKPEEKKIPKWLQKGLLKKKT